MRMLMSSEVPLKRAALSNQEAKVLALATTGLSDKEVALKLGIRLDTVRTYWDRIRQKHSGASRSEIVAAEARRDIEEVLKSIELENEILRASEAQFKAFADSMPQFVWAKRADGQFYYFNQRLLDYVGATLEEALETELIYAIHPDDLAPGRSTIEHGVALGNVYELRYRLRAKDGSYRWFLARTAPLFNESGDLTGWVGTGTDIHEKTIATKALALNERLMSQAERLGNIGSWEYDPVSGTALWSRAMHDLLNFGIPGTPLHFSEYRHLIFKGDVEQFERTFNESLEKAASFDMSFRLHTSGGRVGYFRMIAEPEIEKGTVVRMHGLIQDITELMTIRQREHELAESAIVLQDILNSTSDAIVTTDASGNIRLWNEAALRLLDSENKVDEGKAHEVDEARAEAFKTVLQRLFPGETAFFEKASAVANASEPVYRNWKDANGNPIHVNLSASELRGASNSITGFALVVRHISPRGGLPTRQASVLGT